MSKPSATVPSALAGYWDNLQSFRDAVWHIHDEPELGGHCITCLAELEALHRQAVTEQRVSESVLETIEARCWDLWKVVSRAADSADAWGREDIADARERLEQAQRPLYNVLPLPHHPAGERAAKATRRRRRRSATRGPRPLTDRQIEAMQLVGEHKGNFTAAARAAGISRQAMGNHYRIAMKKLGRSATKHGTVPLPCDRRGQPGENRDARTK